MVCLELFDMCHCVLVVRSCVACTAVRDDDGSISFESLVRLLQMLRKCLRMGISHLKCSQVLIAEVWNLTAMQNLSFVGC